MKSKAIFPLLVSTFVGLMLLIVLFFFGIQEQQQLTQRQIEGAINEQTFRTKLISENIKSRIKETSLSSARLAEYLKDNVYQINTSKPLFDTLEYMKDKSIRSKVTRIGKDETSVFLPAGHSTTKEIQHLINAAVLIIDGYGKGSNYNSFVNTWFMTNEGGIIIQWPDLPDFVREASANFSYVNTPWLPLSLYIDISQNTFWTPLSLDPIPNTWMTSSVTPVYIDDKLLGTVGHDITLSELLSSAQLTESDQLTDFIIVDNYDKIIASNTFKNTSPTDYINTSLDNINDSNWSKVLNEFRGQAQTTEGIFTKITNNKLYAITYIEESNWYFITSSSVSKIVQDIESTFNNLEVIAVVSIILEVIIIAIIFSISRKKLYAYIESLKKSHVIIKSEKERYQNLVDNSSNIVYQCSNDKNWTMLYLNGAVENIMGYNKEEFLNKKRYFSQLVHPDDLDYVRDNVNFAINENKQFELVFRFITKDNSIKWVLERGKKITPEHGEEYLEGVIIDISDLKTAQLKLQELNESLDDRVHKKTLALEQTVNQLKSTQERLVETEKLSALGRLVAGIAHEVNTPLGISITASSVIQESLKELNRSFENKTLTSKQFAEQLAIIFESYYMLESNLNRAATLINNFKQTAVDQTSGNYCQFNINQTIKALLSSLQPETNKIPVIPVLECSETLLMNGYPGILTQIISNLILNSTRHAFNGINNPSINIRVTQLKESTIIDYTDNGIGVSPNLHKKIFEPFYTTKRGQGGSGLGLNLVFNMIQKLGGELSFHSEPGNGVCFSISLPTKQTPEPSVFI